MTEPRTVPVLPFPDQEDVLHGHLFIHHSMYLTTRDDMAWMYECHDEDHGFPEWMEHPHTHTAPVLAENEWSWE